MACWWTSAARVPGSSPSLCRFSPAPGGAATAHSETTTTKGAPMARPQDFKYSPTHEWLRVEADVGTVGITDFAVEELSDLVFVDLPAVGDTVTKDSRFGEIESTKTVSDLIAPVSGTVLEVNSDLADHLEVLSQSPFDRGWLIKVRLSKPSEAAQLQIGRASCRERRKRWGGPE